MVSTFHRKKFYLDGRKDGQFLAGLSVSGLCFLPNPSFTTTNRCPKLFLQCFWWPPLEGTLMTDCSSQFQNATNWGQAAQLCGAAVCMFGYDFSHHRVGSVFFARHLMVVKATMLPTCKWICHLILRASVLQENGLEGIFDKFNEWDKFPAIQFMYYFSVLFSF
jgi:hypothetical protein